MSEDRLRKLGKLFCAWNDPDINKSYRSALEGQINGDLVCYRIFELFHDDVLKIWREYIKIPHQERRNFLIDAVPDLKKKEMKKLVKHYCAPNFELKEYVGNGKWRKPKK